MVGAVVVGAGVVVVVVGTVVVVVDGAIVVVDGGGGGSVMGFHGFTGLWLQGFMGF